MTSDAVITPDQRYRYTLWRSWNPFGAIAVWIMLNPSTADADHDDPTIRRCIGFSQAWGCGQLIVANLFALRATNPDALEHAGFPVAIGPANDHHIAACLEDASIIVAAWGARGGLFNRDRAVRQILKPFAAKVHHVGLTLNGNHPRHPLYVPAATKATLWADL